MLVAAVMIVACIPVGAITASAASYPLFVINYDESDENIPQGETGKLNFTIYPEYHNERYNTYVYDENGSQVASASDTYYNTDGTFSKNVTITIDTAELELEPGRYKAEIWLDFYTFYSWHSSPRKSTYYFNVTRPITIKTQPKSTSKFSGEVASVSVKADGDGLTYKWYFKDKGASKFSCSSSVKGSTYKLTMNEARAGRQVYCEITDKYGVSVKTKTVTLYMKQKAKITTQPKNVTVAEGKVATVTVKATGDGLTYKWYYKDKGASKFTYTSTYKGNTYKTSMSSTRAGRQVYCVISDKYGNSVKTNTVTLYRQNTVKITTQPKNMTVAKGKVATATVKATGDGLTYKWYFRDKTAKKYTYTSSYEGNTYKITMNEARAGRLVYCIVTDKYGNSVKTTTVALKMK